MESKKAQKALDYFFGGYNCAQSVFAAFHEEMGLGEAEALRLASSMGGGVGGLREVCGAFTGMSLVMGALRGYDTPDDPEAKKDHYARIQALGARFSDAYGTLICRDLLASHGNLAPTLRSGTRVKQPRASKPGTGKTGKPGKPPWVRRAVNL